MPDITDERAAKWWTEKRRFLVEDMGVDGFKTDGGEYARGEDLRYLNGTRGDSVNALFPVAYAKAFGDLLHSAGKAPVTLRRAGFTGSQSHGTFWAGDESSTWDAFRWSLFAGLSAASSGILDWGWDLGGFSGEVPSAELYLRSAAAAAFVPIMQYHAEFNHNRLPSGSRTPWNIGERNADDRVIPVFRKYAKLSERLVSYLTKQAKYSTDSGAPLMRPLNFDCPDDESVWGFPLQWVLGDDILIPPVTPEGQSAWATYLPSGEWVDAWTVGVSKVSDGHQVSPYSRDPGICEGHGMEAAIPDIQR